MTLKFGHNCDSFAKSDDFRKRFTTIEKFKCLYKINELIGKGSFGCVYSSVRLADGLQVAVKHIDKVKVNDWRYVGPKHYRLPSEIYLMTKLNQIPGVIRLIDWFETEFSFLIVMELPHNSMDLFEFKKLKQNYMFTDLEVRIIFKQILETLHYCLKLGVVHRDIKPENILINTETLAIRLIDFGAGGYPSVNVRQQFGGTTQYCPPEYLRHKTYYSELQMVWSLGVLLYEMICGDIPFQTEDEVMNSRIDYNFPKCVSNEYKSVIQKCLSRNPLRRPSIRTLLSNKLFSDVCSQCPHN